MRYTIIGPDQGEERQIVAATLGDAVREAADGWQAMAVGSGMQGLELLRPFTRLPQSLGRKELSELFGDDRLLVFHMLVKEGVVEGRTGLTGPTITDTGSLVDWQGENWWTLVVGGVSLLLSHFVVDSHYGATVGPMLLWSGLTARVLERHRREPGIWMLGGLVLGMTALLLVLIGQRGVAGTRWPEEDEGSLSAVILLAHGLCVGYRMRASLRLRQSIRHAIRG